MNLTLSNRGNHAARAAICLARSYEAGRPKKLIPLIWEATGPAGLFPRFEGKLEICSSGASGQAASPWHWPTLTRR